MEFIDEPWHVSCLRCHHHSNVPCPFLMPKSLILNWYFHLREKQMIPYIVQNVGASKRLPSSCWRFALVLLIVKMNNKWSPQTLYVSLLINHQLICENVASLEFSLWRALVILRSSWRWSCLVCLSDNITVIFFFFNKNHASSLSDPRIMPLD